MQTTCNELEFGQKQSFTAIGQRDRSKLLKIPYNQNVLSGNSLVWANFIGILVWSNYTEFFSQSNCSRCMFLIDTTYQENIKRTVLFVFSTYIVQFMDLCSALYCIESFFISFWFWYFMLGQRYLVREKASLSTTFPEKCNFIMKHLFL